MTKKRSFYMRGLLTSALAFALASCSFPAASKQDDDDTPPLSLKGMTETLSFTTDEGTWISVDVTPDGTGIVFDLLGDLYRTPIGGGTATRLTQGLGFDSQPSVSPDGKWIAFISDRNGKNNLWIANSDGSDPRKITSHKSTTIVSPTWSPDSVYILVSEVSDKTNLVMYHRGGGNGVKLKAKGDDAEIRGVGAKFSPDGNSIYFAEPTRNRGVSIPGAQIKRFDRDTGTVSPITQSAGGAFRPVISSDGKLLVYATRDEAQTKLRVRNLESGADRELIADIQRDAQESGRIPSRDYLPAYDFTPDGNHLIITLDGKLSSVDITSGASSFVAFSANVKLDVGPDLTSPYRVDQGPVTAQIVHDPVFSPNGDNIIASLLGKVYQTPIAANGQAKRLTSGDALEYNPIYSPDGRDIAYVTWSDKTGGHIWRTASDGTGTPKRLTEHAGFYTDLAWSPDGQRLVFMRGNEWTRHQTYSEFGGLDTPMELAYMPADGGAVTVIRSVDDGERDPHFASGSERVFLYSGEALISLDYDGRDERTHLIAKGPTRGRNEDDRFAAQMRVRPDGAWAVALVNDQVWVMPMPMLGSEAPTISVRDPGLPAVRLTDVGADFIGWSEDGKNVVWAIGSTVYSRAFDSINFFENKDDKDDDKSMPEDHTAVIARKVNVSVPRATPEGAILLSGATVLTMEGNSTAAMSAGLENTDILIVDNKIKAIGAKGSLKTPAGVKTIDVTGKTIMPGLIDTHAHWEFRTQDVLEPQNWSLAANLAYGVTAGLDVQTSHKDYFTYRDFVDAGMSVGQRAFMTGPGVFGNTNFQSYERTLAYLKRYSDHYGTKNIKSYLVGNRQQRQWVVRASKELGIMPTTEGGGDMRLDLTHAIDGMHGNEHTLPILPLRRDVIELFAKTKTAYTATLVVQYQALSAVDYFFTRYNPHDDEKLARFYPENRIDVLTRRRRTWARDDEFNFAEAAAGVADIQRAGGLVGIGGHGELQGLGFHWEMQAHALGGMTPPEILRAATIDGAKIIGISQDLGSLKAGKLADLVVLGSDPRIDISNTLDILYVMKNGELYEGDTLDRILPTPQPLETFWWSGK